MPSIEEGCRLCGSTRTRPLFTKGQTPYWECADCGFRFATPPTNPNFVTAIGDYEAAYLQYLGPDESDEANLSSLCDWMQRITPLEGRRLLDIGAGSGKLVRFLRARRVEAHGIEPSRALFDRFLATEEAFTCAMLDRYRSAAAAPFDIVTAFDVIEHVPDPSRSSATWRRSSNQAGCSSPRRRTPGVFLRERSAAAGTSTTRTTCRTSRRDRSRARPSLRDCTSSIAGIAAGSDQPGT